MTHISTLGLGKVIHTSSRTPNLLVVEDAAAKRRTLGTYQNMIGGLDGAAPLQSNQLIG